MTDPLLGVASLTTAFFAGILALLAPCCLTFLLPSYLAAGLQQGRWRLLRMTATYSAGLAAVLLPVAWGVAGLAQLLPTLHREIFFIGGMLLLGLGALSLTGRGWTMPMPWSPDMRRRDGLSVFALGAFSGAASSCCAPVLAGVLALSFVAPSWWLGIGVGLAYVFGMVFPLLLVAVFGQRFNVLGRRWLRPRPLALPLGPWRPRVLTTNLASAVLLWTMGGLVLWNGATGNTAYAPDFMLGLYAELRRLFDGLTELAGPFAVLIPLLAVGLIVLLAFGRRSEPGPPDVRPPTGGPEVRRTVEASVAPGAE